MATLSNDIKELPEDEPEDVLFNALYGLRTIELNRPQKLHSLNGSMIRKIVPRLQEWTKSDMANVIVLKGSGPKAFCAGGDVAHLAKMNAEGPEGQQKSADYFALEYKLDHYLATYEKPLVAFMDGITMGGGVGLSIHTPFRIATERTVFAMPETTIGFFPDVGASFFLPRMNGAVGTYLALTSDRVTGVNAFYAGIATHYIHSTSLPALESRLAELQFGDHDNMQKRCSLINSTIEEFCTGLPHDEPIMIAGAVREAIDRCFSQDSVPQILSALKAETGETQEWAQKTLKTLHQRSPTSVYVTLRQMRLGKKWSIKEAFEREHQMAAKFMQHSDFTEGVSALLIRKPAPGQPREPPKWQPASLEDAKPEDNIAEPFFEVEGKQKMKFLHDKDYVQYRYHFGLPSETSVHDFVKESTKTPKGVVRHFVEEYDGKQGVKEVVEEIVARKCSVEDGKAVWSAQQQVAASQVEPSAPQEASAVPENL
jgi:3-hydroxyisobutyryl-CoA hydrolase